VTHRNLALIDQAGKEAGGRVRCWTLFWHTGL